MDETIRQNALRKLAQTEGEAAQSALEKEVRRISDTLETDSSYDKLKSQLEALEVFAYRVPRQASESITHFLDQLPRLKLTHSEEHDFFGDRIAKYQSKESLCIMSLSVLRRIRYHEPKTAVMTFLSYATSQDKEIAREAEEGLSEIAGYNIDVFYGNENISGLGTYPQKKVLEALNSLEPESLKKHLSGIMILCREILSPTLEGTSSDYKTVTLRSAAIPAVDAIKDVRQQTLEFLEGLYSHAESISDKLDIVNTIYVATQTPYTSEYSDDTFEMIVQNSVMVLDIFSRIIMSNELPVIQKIEHNSYWLNQNRTDPQIRSTTLQVKETIDSHAEYQVYKVLIGFEGVFGEWRLPDEIDARAKIDHRRDIRYEKDYRNEKVREFAASIDDSNVEEWSNRIVRYAAIESQDLATFPYFAQFLELFSEASPSLAIEIIKANASDLEPFFACFFCGLWRSKAKQDARDLMQTWVLEGKFLYACARVFEFNGEPQDPIVNDIFEQSVKAGDRKALVRLMVAVVANLNPKDDSLVKSIFMPSINYLTLHSDVSWIYDSWFRREIRDLMTMLDKDEQDSVLANLQALEKVDYHAEEIILPIAETRPDAVIDFFVKRLSLKEEFDSDYRYEAIPFEFYKLADPLSSIPEKAIQTVFTLYDGNYGLFVFRGARLLKNIFVSFPEEFENELIRMVQQGGNDAVLFVLAVLRNYDGDVSIHQACKEIVKKLPVDSDLLREVEIVLESTGVVSGEFGVAIAYEKKVKEIEPWLMDDDDRIRRFAADYSANLERFAEAERKRATEEIEIRKHKFGSDDDK